MSLHSYLDTYAQRIHLHFQLNQCKVQPSDLSLCFPRLTLLDDMVEVQASIDGSLDSISASHLSLRYGNEPIFVGQCSALGLPNWKEAYLYAQCQDLSIRPVTIETFMSDLFHRPFVLPIEFHRLGQVHYKGIAQGRLTHFLLDGAFSTQFGVVTTHGTCVADSNFQSCTINGRIGTRRFQIGRLIDNKDLKFISLGMNTSIHLSSMGNPQGDVQMTIDEFEYKDYAYNSLVVEGEFNHWAGDAHICIDDPNLALDVLGTFDFNGDSLHFLDATIHLNHLYPNALNLSEQWKQIALGTKIDIHQQFTDLDHFKGKVVIDSTWVAKQDALMKIGTILLTASETEEQQTLRCCGDLFTASLAGHFRVTQLANLVRYEMAYYLPSLFTQEQITRWDNWNSDMRFDFSLLAHNIHALEQTLQLPIILSDNSALYGYYSDEEKQWGMEVHVPSITLSNADLHGVSLFVDNAQQRINLELKMELDSTMLGVRMRAVGDSIALGIMADALPPNTNHGELSSMTYISHYAGKPFINSYFYPGILQLGDSLYHLEDAQVTYTMADTSIVLDGFRLYGKSQFIKADGIISPKVEDSLSIHLEHINIGLIMPFLLPPQTLTVDGKASGYANLYSLLGTPMFEAQIKVDSTLFNKSDFGTITAQMELDKEKQNILIDGEAWHHERKAAIVHGVVEPKNQYFKIDIKTDSMPISFVEHWTHAFLQDYTGTVSGDVSVIGKKRKTWVLSHAKPNQASFVVPFTGCRYFVNDTIVMDSTSIHFPHLTLYDEEDNKLAFDGTLTHNEYFRDFTLDLHAQCNHTLALHLPHAYGQLMEGKVYATGSVDIVGTDNDIQLNANALAVGKSRFQLSLGATATAHDNSFVQFVEHSTLPTFAVRDTIRFIPQRRNPLFAKENSRFRMTMNMDIDPQTLFQFVLNERTGDVIEARGDGSVKFTLDDATNDIQLVGTYTIASGKMGFTVGNLIRREFTIMDGSQIIWNGKAEQPILNVTAKYQVTTSLKDLFGTETEQLISGRTTIPVATMIHLSGPLDDPIIRFGIELPKSEENIENQVKAIINTEEMMMREVVYLLVFGKFFTPDYVKDADSRSSTLNSTYALLSSTITGQINNWLGRLTDAFTLGFNFRSEGTDQNSAQEYEAVFQLQPVDRLIINGNFGYRYNDISNRPFFGDLDIECLLTPNGKYRLKGYTHTVDKYSLKQASTVQGIGFLFHHEFNWKRTDEEREFMEAQKAAKAAEREQKQEDKIAERTRRKEGSK